MLRRTSRWRPITSATTEASLRGQAVLLEEVGELERASSGRSATFSRSSAIWASAISRWLLLDRYSPGRHAEDARQAGRDAGDKDGIAIVRGAAHRAHDRERAHQAVLGSEDRFAHIAQETRPVALLVQASSHACAVEALFPAPCAGLLAGRHPSSLVHAQSFAGHYAAVASSISTRFG